MSKDTDTSDAEYADGGDDRPGLDDLEPARPAPCAGWSWCRSMPWCRGAAPA